jgi:hypothetical protein
MIDLEGIRSRAYRLCGMDSIELVRAVVADVDSLIVEIERLYRGVADYSGGGRKHLLAFVGNRSATASDRNCGMPCAGDELCEDCAPRSNPEHVARIAELQLLAARAEASVQMSLGTARYTSVRTVAFMHDAGSHRTGPSSTAFKMFAVSAETEGRPRDIMLCRTPEMANFFVALLKFGGEIVAKCGDSATSNLTTS